MAKLATLVIAGSMFLMALGSTALVSGEPGPSDNVVANLSQTAVTPFNVTAYMYGLMWSADADQYGNWTESMYSTEPDFVPFNYSISDRTVMMDFSSSTVVNFSFSGLHHGKSLWIANPHSPQNSMDFFGIATLTLGGYVIFNGSVPSEDNFVGLALFAWVYFPQEYVDYMPGYAQNATYVPGMHAYLVMTEAFILLPNELSYDQTMELFSVIPYLGLFPTNEVQKTSISGPMGVNNFSF